jgi:hypothetical protein
MSLELIQLSGLQLNWLLIQAKIIRRSDFFFELADYAQNHHRSLTFRQYHAVIRFHPEFEQLTLKHIQNVENHLKRQLGGIRNCKEHLNVTDFSEIGQSGGPQWCTPDDL